MVDRAGWGRGRNRAGSSAGREAVLERRTREVGTRTRSTAEGKARGERTAHLEGERKEFHLVPTLEPSLVCPQGKEGGVVQPCRFLQAIEYSRVLLHHTLL